jgi:hypothetical protein
VIGGLDLHAAPPQFSTNGALRRLINFDTITQNCAIPYIVYF